jgi:hypothetical protein
MNDSRSREALLGFLDYCKDKGLMKPPTAEARKAAVNQVLGILSEDEASDVTKIDLELLMRRFQNLHGSRYSPDSLRTYRARVKNSISDFIRFRENPMDFKPSAGSATKRNSTAKPTKPSASTKPSLDAPAPSVSAPFMTTSTLPIPIRQDLTVLVHGLPFDLTEMEARKIANVVLALAGVPAP